MKIGRILLIVSLVLVVFIAVLFGMNFLELYPYEGTTIKMHDEYRLDFIQMNKTDTHTMAVRPGDELVVSFDIAQGTVGLTISVGETRLYRGDKIDTASFTLPVETEGDCLVEVKGSGARGGLSVAVKTKAQ